MSAFSTRSNINVESSSDIDSFNMTPSHLETPSKVAYDLDLEMESTILDPRIRTKTEESTMSDETLLHSNKPRSFTVHVDDVRITRKRQLIPSCIFKGRIKVGKLPEWTIQFSQKELLRLHVCVNWYLLCRFEKFVWMPWSLIWEKRATKRCNDLEVVERYLCKLVAMPRLHECEALMSFLEVSPLRIQTNLRTLSLKEGYVHMKINGSNQIPLQKFCSRRMEKVYRHSYRIFLRIAFVACMLLLVWPFLMIAIVAVFNPLFLTEMIHATFGQDISFTIAVIMFIFGILFCLGFVYKFFERRLGTVRRWAAIKSNCIAFFRSRTDLEPSEVFLFDTQFELAEGNYRQGVSWMVNGMTVRNKSGYVEIDYGHYYTRLLSVLALSLSFFVVVNISINGYQFQTLQPSSTRNFLASNESLSGSFCGYVFNVPDHPVIFKRVDNYTKILVVSQQDDNEYVVTNDYNDDGYVSNLLTPRVFSTFFAKGLQVAVVGPAGRSGIGVTQTLNMTSNIKPVTLHGITGLYDESYRVPVNETLSSSNELCAFPVQYSPVTLTTLSIVIGALLVGSALASSLGLMANYIFSWIGIWHAHVRRDIWIETLNQLPPQPSRHRFLSYAPQRQEGFLKWHVDGADTYKAMKDAILSAKHQILIAGWWVCPDILLERNDEPSRIALKDLLLEKAQEGVLIHILLYQEVQVAMDLGSYYAMKQLKCHPNIRVLRDPAFQVQSFGFWSHHEKVVVVDFDIGFVGGLDLAFGRYDTCQHLLSDPGHDEGNHMWPGKDYSNPIIKDFVRVNDPHENLIDRNNVPRMPWHDVHCSIVGQAVQDVAYHFIERWNFVCSKRDNSLRTDWCVCCRSRRFKRLPKCIVPWTPHATPLPRPSSEYQPCSLQLLRSVSSWSAGVPTESSIHTAYCDRIRAAQHYVYIENQFFISGLEENTIIMNRIVQALVDRIALAHAHRQVFRVIVVMPLLPGIEGNIQSKQSLTHLHAVMHWQYETIRTSLMGAVSKITSKPSDYVMFFGLRTYGVMPNGRCVTEQIYIHSKVFITDDTTIICGSANINDRSMNGDRDSEIAVLVEDTTFFPGSMNGRAYSHGTLATKLRLELFHEHLGLSDPTVLLDVVSESTWNFMNGRAQANTDLFEHVFRCAPSNTYRSFDCFDSQWHQLDAIYENQRLNPLKGRGAWGADNLSQEGDYAPWTDVNGVPIPMEKVNWDEYVVVPDPLFPLLSTDDQGWYYARNFKIFQEMRVLHTTTPRVRKRDKFQHFMADRLLAQVRRRKYVKLSTLPVLSGEYIDTVPLLRDDDKDTFYSKWRQWAKKLKPPVLPPAVLEYREMIEPGTPRFNRSNPVRTVIASRHSDSELEYPKSRPVLRLSASEVKDTLQKEPPRSWISAMPSFELPPLFKAMRATMDRIDSHEGDDIDDESDDGGGNVVSPSPSLAASIISEAQLGNVHTNAETQEVTAHTTLSAIQGEESDVWIFTMKKPPAIPRPIENHQVDELELDSSNSLQEEQGDVVDSLEGDEGEMLTREELEAMHAEIEHASPTYGKFMYRSRSRSAGQLITRRTKSFIRSASAACDKSDVLEQLEQESSPGKEIPKSSPLPLPPKKEKSFGSSKKPAVYKKQPSRWDSLRSSTMKKSNSKRHEDKDNDEVNKSEAAKKNQQLKSMADVAKQVIYTKRASSHMKLNVNGTSGRNAINGLFLEKKKLDLRILSAQFNEVKRSEFYEELVVYSVFLMMFFQLLSGLPFHGSFQQSDVTADLTCSVPDACSIQSPQDIYSFASHLKERICLKNDSALPFQTWTRVGGILFRQIRVQPEPCRFSFIHGPEQVCYPELFGDNEETSLLVRSNRNYSWSDNLEPWIPGQNSWYATRAHSFGTGGYVVDICQVESIQVLENDLWLDIATRAVSIEFVVVNPSTHVFTVASHEFVINPSGHLKHFSQSANMRVIGLEESMARTWLFDSRLYLWFGVCIFVITYFRREVTEMNKMGLTSYLMVHGWNSFELAHLTLLFSTLYYISIYFSQSIHTISVMLIQDSDGVHRAMIQLLDTFLQLNDFAAVSSAFSLLKIFKFLRMNSTLNLLWQVLGMALKDLMGYMIIFLLIFLSYSTMGSFAFGFDLHEFSSISTSFATCFHMLAGDFPYDRLVQANPRLAPVFFVTFVVLVLQIMVNMFVAILSEYYENVKSIENDENEIEYDIINRLREFLSACAPTVDLNNETILLHPNQTVRLISTNLVDKEKIRTRARKLFRGVVWRIVALLRFGMKFDQKLNFIKTTKIFSESNRIRYIPLSENFDHNTIKTMLPKGITIKLQGDAILGQHILLRVVQHGDLSVECMVLPGEYPEDIMELLGGEKLKLPFRLFLFHVFKFLLRELQDGILRATKWWDPYESKIVDDYHLYQLLAEERIRGKTTLRFDELSRLLDLYIRKEKRNREYSHDEIKHETALVMYRFRNSLIDMPSREKEGHDYIPNPVDTSCVELSINLLSLGEHMAENCHDIWALERIQQGWKWGPRRDDILKQHPNLIPFKEMSKEEQNYDFRTSMETIKTIVAMKYNIARGRRGADGITRTLTHSNSNASDKSGNTSPKSISQMSGILPRSFSLMDATIIIPYGKHGKEYKPRPADTSAVVFPASLRRLMDLLAENAHEVWSKGRMDDGWTYGQKRDDKMKKHPCLVPYVFLTDAEKDYDLKTAEATLKMLYALGYIIVDSNGHNLV